MKPSIRRIFSAALVFALIVNLFATAAFAKSSRTALITEVSGDVTVTKGGGANPIPAFPNMPLNQGDSIETGEDGSLTVKIADPESERTIGPNTSMTVTELSESASGKKNGFKIFVGSVWNKVKSLAAGDEDGVDTPTATMGVRGTNYLVIVNPDGTLSVVVASGFVAARLTGGELIPAEKMTVLLAPTQQMNLNPQAPPHQLQNAVNIVDVSKVVHQADPSILKAFIVSAPAITAENQQFINSLRDSLQNGQKPVLKRGGAVSDLQVGSLEDLNRVSQNVNGLVGNVASSASNAGKLSATVLQQLINLANGQIIDPNARIDLTKTKPIDRSAGVDPAQEVAKKAEQDRIVSLQQQRERQRQQEALNQQLSALLLKALEQRQQAAEANKKAQEELNKKAEEKFVSGLSDAEKMRYNTNKNNLPAQTTPAATPSSNGTDSTPATPTMVELKEVKTTDGFDLQVSLKGFTGTKCIYGAELHFVGDPGAKVTLVALNDAKFPNANSANVVKSVAGSVDGASKLETIFAVTRFNTEKPVEFSNAGEQLATLHFTIPLNAASFKYKLAYVLLVDENGIEVPVAVKPASTQEFTYTK